MNKKHLLFVDDEPNILSGIKRMMRPLRDQFELSFAEDGQQALELMAREKIDILVSDMRMPVMDGAELFNRVKEEFPHAVRIMLTGQADDESVLKTVSVVHQFLTKPCAPEALKEVLVRAAALLDLMQNERLKDIISGVDSLPSLPSVYAKLQEALSDPETGPDQIAEIIEQDVAMTAKLMQLVNSSFFGLYTKVDTPGRAVKLLGLDTIKILVLGVQIFAEMKTAPDLISMDYLWRHSMAVAHASKKIAAEATENQDLINYCFLSGLLHDIGRLLLLSKLENDYRPVVESSIQQQIRLPLMENTLMQTTHADVGAYLIGLWGFNADVVEAIAFHNDLDRYPATNFSAALAVHIADTCYYNYFSDDVIGAAPFLNEKYLKNLGFGDISSQWYSICEKEFAKYDGND